MPIESQAKCLLRIFASRHEAQGMAQLAQIGVIAAPACPGCRNRLTGLPLDELAENPEYQCPFCGEQMRIPQQILMKLIQQRDEQLAAHKKQGNFFTRALDILSRLFGLDGKK